MVRNAPRREALVDAAIEVLANKGARGLTFRAVDAEAAVPTGTTSNYFTSRDDLLNHVGAQIHQRTRPDATTLQLAVDGPPTRQTVARLMTDIVDRVGRDRTGWLAMMELRLEATRRPELRASLTETIAQDLRQNIDLHLGAGLPGDETTVVLLALAMSGLLTEQLTLPEVLATYGVDRLIEALVARF